MNGAAIAAYDDTSKTFVITCYGNATISWAKLEKGNVKTHYVPKGYGAELSECVRYFTRFHISERCAGVDVGDGVRIYTTYTINKMRTGVVPTVVIKNKSYWGSCSGMVSEVIGTAGNPTYASVVVRVNGSGAFGALLEISADL